MYQTTSYSHIGGRSCNEDAVCCRTFGGGVCAVLADGLGGHGGGDRASQMVCQTVSDAFTGQADAAELTLWLQTAHEKIRMMQTPRCRMKSTAVVLAIAAGRAAWAHVGDSRLYHFVDGKLVFQTSDHSASQLAVKLGEIQADQIRFHEDRSRILRALGQEGNLKVDARQEKLAPGRHAFLLCSDGFWEYVLEEEMAEDLRLSRDPQQWIRRMRARLAGRVCGDHDNHTAAAVWLTQA